MRKQLWLSTVAVLATVVVASAQQAPDKHGGQGGAAQGKAAAQPANQAATHAQGGPGGGAAVGAAHRAPQMSRQNAEPRTSGSAQQSEPSRAERGASHERSAQDKSGMNAGRAHAQSTRQHEQSRAQAQSKSPTT